MTTAEHGSPGRDPVVTAMKAIAAVLAVIAVVMLIRLASDGPNIQCPPQDHPVYAQTIHQWICGDSLTVGVKAS